MISRALNTHTHREIERDRAKVAKIKVNSNNKCPHAHKKRHAVLLSDKSLRWRTEIYAVNLNL